MSTPGIVLWDCCSVIRLIAGGVALLHAGLYGWTIFVFFPIVLGGLASSPEWSAGLFSYWRCLPVRNKRS
jgi:hypothetical protein